MVCKNDVKKLQVSGFYRDVDLGEPVQIHTDVEKKKAEEQGYSVNEDDRYQIAEIQIDWNLKGYEHEDEIALPYIIAIDRGTNKVLAIYRNYEEDDETYTKPNGFLNDKAWYHPDDLFSNLPNSYDLILVDYTILS